MDLTRKFAATAAAVMFLLFNGALWSARGQEISHEAMKAEKPGAAIPLSGSAFEERFGIQVTLIGVTGGGGLIDFRFKIVDTQKARQLLADPGVIPTLLVEENGVRLMPSHGMMKNIRLQNGAVSMLLYPNVNNAIKSCAQVTVVFGDVRLEPIKAQ